MRDTLPLASSLESIFENVPCLDEFPQPYRTTPLVLPGAKTGRDTASTTQSYLALQTQQNAMLWNTPNAPYHPQQITAAHPSSSDVILKQKVGYPNIYIQ